MIFLQAVLIMLYFMFASWLVIATYLNYIVVPFTQTNFRLTNKISVTYACLWGLVLSAPAVYGMIF